MVKLIETDFPFAQLSVVAEHESWRKEVHRPVYYLHKWWARRLGSVFRGIVLGACLEQGQDFWPRFYGKNKFSGTVVFDPFMGSGVTIGEAIKLGCGAVGRDINPVAYIACRAAFSSYSYTDVVAMYDRLSHELAPRLLSYFRTQTKSGEEATVLYYFLVKVIRCPKCEKDIDLFSTRIFSANAMPGKDPSARSICPRCGDVNHTRYDANRVECQACGMIYDPKVGNIKGPSVICDGCRHTFRVVDRMKHIAGPLQYRRYAKMILTSDGRKFYEKFNEYDRSVQEHIAEEYFGIAESLPRVAIAAGYNTNQMLKHNYCYWHELFTDRQLLCIAHFVRSLGAIEDANLRVLFACVFSGALEFNNLFASFKGEGTGAVRHMFSHHVLKPETMPIEANFWGTPSSSGSFSGLFELRVKRALAYKADPTELMMEGGKARKIGGINHQMAVAIASDANEFVRFYGAAYLSNGDSGCIDLPDRSVDVIVTDPPFFDNVHYSELADFFYYWLNQILRLSPSLTTRSISEVQDTDAQRFSEKLAGVFTEGCRVLTDTGLLVFTYHHSRHEGWTAVHRAIREAGFVCVKAYPIKAEMSGSMPLRQAKSPIQLDLILVCRKAAGAAIPSGAGDPVRTALVAATEQARELKSAGLSVSRGDAKVIVMGQVLCEAHRMRNVEQEEAFIESFDRRIDSFGEEVASTRGEILYAETPQAELALFEEMTAFVAAGTAAK